MTSKVLSRLMACVLVMSLAACSPNRSASEKTTSTSISSEPAEGSSVVTDPSAESTTSVEETTTTTMPKMVLSGTLSKGNQGPEVMAVQQRLNDLHFDVDKADGIFGTNTEMAVWAYQALILNKRGKEIDGRVTPQLWDRMQDPLGLANKRPNATATHAEVYLQAQTMVLYVQNQLRLITHVSSGTGEHWCAKVRVLPVPGATTTTLGPGAKEATKDMCGDSITPGGSYRVTYKRQGEVDIPLGHVFNPIFFNGGIAIHGYAEVPKNPASHGCVRVPMFIAKYLPDLLRVGDQIFVWDGVKEPEVYGAQRAPIDIPDPTATTTTSTTSTTVKPTTTTVAGTTTTKPGATTTTAPKPTTVATTAATTVAPTTTATTAAPKAETSVAKA